MNETVLVAVIAVLGTALGAAISPIVELLSKSISSKSDGRSERIRAVAEFCAQLRVFAKMTIPDWDKYDVSRAHSETVAQRYEVAKVIPRGAGRVDWFCEHAIEVISGYGSAPIRIAAAEYAASQLLAWARGDKKPRELTAFRMESDGDGGFIPV